MTDAILLFCCVKSPPVCTEGPSGPGLHSQHTALLVVLTSQLFHVPNARSCSHALSASWAFCGSPLGCSVPAVPCQVPLCPLLCPAPGSLSLPLWLLGVVFPSGSLQGRSNSSFPSSPVQLLGLHQLSIQAHGISGCQVTLEDHFCAAVTPGSCGGLVGRNIYIINKAYYCSASP